MYNDKGGGRKGARGKIRGGKSGRLQPITAEQVGTANGGTKNK